jgi:hypothetical protein
MVNANCDFCSNTYRKVPGAGYFKVTANLKSSLCIREWADLNTICGDHFKECDISESGRLRAEARPVFFPRLSTAAHDHTYYDPGESQDETEGIFTFHFVRFLFFFSFGDLSNIMTIIIRDK